MGLFYLCYKVPALLAMYRFDAINMKEQKVFLLITIRFMWSTNAHPDKIKITV